MQAAHADKYDFSPRVLIAEDDWYMRQTLEALYRREGYRVASCEDGSSAAHELITGNPYDLAVLDMVMPGQTGLEVVTRIRHNGITVPVIIVSGCTNTEDRVRVLNSGADDFISKPLNSMELIARSSAVRRRSESTGAMPKVIRMSNVVVNFEVYVAQRKEKRIHLTRLEWDVLRYLAYRRGRAVSRPEFNVHVLKIPADIATRTIDRHAYALRCKIDDDPQRPHHIVAVRGVGYRLDDFEVLS